MRPQGHSRGGRRGRGSGCPTGVRLMNGARRNALDMDMAHGHEHACRGTHKYQRRIDEAPPSMQSGREKEGWRGGSKVKREKKQTCWQANYGRRAKVIHTRHCKVEKNAKRGE